MINSDFATVTDRIPEIFQASFYLQQIRLNSKNATQEKDFNFKEKHTVLIIHVKGIWDAYRKGWNIAFLEYVLFQKHLLSINQGIDFLIINSKYVHGIDRFRFDQKPPSPYFLIM